MSIDEIPKTALSPGFETNGFKQGELKAGGLRPEQPNSDANSGQPESDQEAVPASLAQPIHILVQPKEVGGRIGADPTRYGDWEKNGRCIDF